MFSSLYHDIIKIIDDQYLVVAGMDNRVRVFNIETEKLMVKFEPHDEISYVCLIEIQDKILFSYAANEIVKYEYLTKEFICAV
jgi:WD40 repeat protein